MASRSAVRGPRLLGVYAWYVVAFVVFVGPMLFMLWSGFRNNADVIATSIDPTSALTFSNYQRLFERFDFGRYLVNSLIIAGSSTALALVIGAPAAYGIVRSGRRRLGLLPLTARMAPGILFVLPLFLFAIRIDAPSNTALNYLMLIVAHLIITLPLCVWLVMPFIEEIPIELEEAAMIDGAGPLRRFLRVALPLAAPGLAVAMVISFILSWNFFLFALALANEQTLPLTVIAFNFIGQGSNDYAGLMAASTLISLPALVLTIVAQRWLVRGITGGAVK